MKTKMYVLMGIGAAVAGFAAYMLLRKKPQAPSLRLHEKERKHLTNVFAKAKNPMGV